jgi:hypothetical protein
MKKTLAAAALSSVMVLGLAASGFAADDTTTGVVTKGASKITLDGSVRERGMYDKNSAVDGSQSRTAYDSRVQLGVNAQVSDQATGYVKLESGTDSGDTDMWGNDHATGLFTGGDKANGLTLLEAWVNYNPGSWGVKAGHMPLALGNKIFFDHTGSGDDALVFYTNLGEATHIAALTIKFDEQFVNDSSDDLDGYVALVTHKVSDSLNLGANLTYLRGGADSTDPTDRNIVTGVITAGAELWQGLSMSNMGLTADGKIGAIEYMADAEFQFGTVFDDGTNNGDVDASGWAAKVGGKYDLGVGKIGLLFGYGSGNDLDDTDNDADNFINFLTDTTYDTIIAGYRSNIPGNGMGGLNSGLSNLTLIQLNGSTKTACPLTGKDLSLFASASYMQLSEDMDNDPTVLGTNHVDNVGTELDLIATWALTAGLSYKIEAAYMWTGDVYETEIAGDTINGENLAFVRHGLDLKF